MYSCICLCKFIDFSSFSWKLSVTKSMSVFAEGAGSRFVSCNGVIRTSF